MTTLSETSATAPETGEFLRLRPSVHASPVPDGIYLRGWRTAFTVTGGADLWRLWQRLEPVLRRGVAVERLAAVAMRPTMAQAVRRLLAALREHEMTLPVATGWWHAAAGVPERWMADWLEQVAPDPPDAWRRLSAATVTITCADTVPGTALADSAAYAFAAAGVRVAPRRARPAPAHPWTVRLTAGSTVVIAGMGEHYGFVAPAAAPSEAVAVAGRVAGRFGIAGRPSSAVAPGSQALAALLGGAAADRLIRVIAGIPDQAPGPVVADDAQTPAVPPNSWPMVLVARPDPLVAAYHPWLLDGAAPARASIDFDVVLRRLAALCDPYLGVLPAPRFEDLPQVPAGLAICATAGRPAVGVGVSTDAARLDAALRCAERRLDPAGTGRLAVGVDGQHADGILLRRAAYWVAGRAATLAASPGTEDGWRADPRARRWWRTLTARYGLHARCVVAQLASGVYVARIEASGQELAWAVEADAGTAVAVAGLRGAAAHQARLAGVPSDSAPPTVCGATPARRPPYEALDWLTVPGDQMDGRSVERCLQEALRRIVPQASWPRPAQARSGEVWSALVAAGFTVREAE